MVHVPDKPSDRGEHFCQFILNPTIHGKVMIRTRFHTCKAKANNSVIYEGTFKVHVRKASPH